MRFWIIGVYIVITSLIVIYIDQEIRAFNLDFYAGKDDGYFARFESIFILTISFYTLLSAYDYRSILKTFLFAFIGVFVSIVVSILFYLILPIEDQYGTVFHVTVLLINYLLYFAFFKWINKVKIT